MKHYTRWTEAEDTMLRELYLTLSAGQIALRMGRTMPGVKNRINHLRLKKPAGITNPGCFIAGQAAWNKGMKGLSLGGEAGWFKPGNRSGRAIEIYQPIGTERISKDGYRQRKINDAMPLHKRWRGVHIIEWEAINGPLPKGHALTFINGDKTDCRLDNLVCITRRELMLRNTVHNYPPELRQVIRLKAAISKRIATRIKKEQQA